MGSGALGDLGKWGMGLENAGAMLCGQKSKVQGDPAYIHNGRDPGPGRRIIAGCAIEAAAKTGADKWRFKKRAAWR